MHVPFGAAHNITHAEESTALITAEEYRTIESGVITRTLRAFDSGL